MAISPVSSVSFNRSNMANNVAFEGKKNKSENHRGMTNSLRAVPLAALIAMSPMVKSEKAFSLEPKRIDVEQLHNVKSPDQTPVVPMPKNWTVLKEVVIDQEHFLLIDIDGDHSNFEYLEYRDISGSGKVMNRGMLRGVDVLLDDAGSIANIFGIPLDKNILNNYAPQQGQFDVLHASINEEEAEFYLALTIIPENHYAVREMDPSRYFSSKFGYSNDLDFYKEKLGIK